MHTRTALSAPAVPTSWPLSASAWHKISGPFSDRELAAVLLFCAIGLLASILMALSFPLSDDVATFLAQVL
jgi:hypothetical protein